MASRYRWFKVEWPTSIGALARQLKAQSFDRGSSHGFVLDRVRNDLIEGKYVERIQYVDTVVDPFGDETSFERIEYRSSAFRIGAGVEGLEVKNPPRSIQPLMNRLSEATDFRVAITDHVVNVMDWAMSFQAESGAKAVVDSLQLKSLQLAEGVVASVVIKGDRDVRDACAVLADKRSYILDKIQLRLVAPYAGTVILSRNASVAIKADDPEGILLSALRMGM